MSEDLFIKHLCSLPTLAKYDTGQIAAYRRACGQRLAESKGCQDFAAISSRPPDFLTVTLAAQYSSDKIEKKKHNVEHWIDLPDGKKKRNALKGSVGAAWAAYCKKQEAKKDPHVFYRGRQEDLANGKSPENIPSIHERFRTVLDAELELDGTGELAYRLRGLVRMLAAEDIPIDVIQLARDLRGWRAESRYVQENWAKAFYAPPYTQAAETPESEASQTEGDGIDAYHEQEEIDDE